MIFPLESITSLLSTPSSCLNCNDYTNGKKNMSETRHLSPSDRLFSVLSNDWSSEEMVLCVVPLDIVCIHVLALRHSENIVCYLYIQDTVGLSIKCRYYNTLFMWGTVLLFLRCSLLQTSSADDFFFTTRWRPLTFHCDVRWREAVIQQVTCAR